MKIGFTYDERDSHTPDENSPVDFYGEFDTKATLAAICGGADQTRARCHSNWQPASPFTLFDGW